MLFIPMLPAKAIYNTLLSTADPKLCLYIPSKDLKTHDNTKSGS